MGCWNETCLVSKLPITMGDETVMILLAENNRHYKEGRICYHDELWSPVSLPIVGEYNDYGKLENISTPEWYQKFLGGVLGLYVVDIPQGENQYHDIEVSKAKLDLDSIQEYIHEGRFRLDHYGSEGSLEKSPVCARAFIRKSMFDKFVNAGFEHYERDFGYRTMHVQEIAERTKKEIKEVADKFEKFMNPDVDRTNPLSLLDELERQSFLCDPERANCWPFIDSRYGMARTIRGQEFRFCVAHCLYTGEDDVFFPQFDEYIKMLAERYMFEINFNNARMILHPYSNPSQETECEMHKLIVQEIQEYAAEQSSDEEE